MAEKKVTTKKSETKVEKKSVLIKSRMTEKAVLQQESRKVYTFNVSPEATKSSVIGSIKAQYKVTPVKVNIVNMAKKEKYFRGAWGKKGGGKKAYVYLKKGDKIDVA